jgi:hypothetical protein
LSPFNFTITYRQTPNVDEYGNCWYGPNTIEPCNICDNFGEIVLGVGAGAYGGGGQSGIYSNYWLKSTVLKEMVNDCTLGPITMNFSGHRSQIEGNYVCPNVIKSIKLSCCSAEEIAACGA